MPYRAMDAAWWTANGAPARWGPTWEGVTHNEYYVGQFVMVQLNPGTDAHGTTLFFQAPFSVGGGGVNQHSDDNYDTGYFYLQELAP